MTENQAFASGWRGVAGLFRGPLRYLVGGQSAGSFGDGLAQISFAQLVLFDVGRGATPARIAAVLAATLLPFSLVGPLAGVLIDRWNRRRILVLGSWLRAVLALGGLATAAAHAEVPAYVFVLLLLSSSRFVLAAKSAVLPGLVRPEKLVQANAVSGLSGMSAAFIGGVGGAMFVALSTVAGFLAAVGAYVVAGLFYRPLPVVHHDVAPDPIGRALRELAVDLARGVRTIATTPALRRPLLAVGTHRMLLGGAFVLVVLVADSRYHLSTPGYGLAVAVTGVAAFGGTVTAPFLVRNRRATVLLPLMFLPPAAAGLLAGYRPSLPVLLGAVAVTAWSFQCLKVLADALLGRAAPDAVRGRVFSLYDVLYNVAFVVAGLVMVPLWHPGAAGRLLWVLSGAYVVAWALFAWASRRSGDGAPPPVAAGPVPGRAGTGA